MCTHHPLSTDSNSGFISSHPPLPTQIILKQLMYYIASFTNILTQISKR